MTNLIKTWANEKNIFAVIETPRGSSEKFAFDPEHHAFALKRVLPVGMVFPFDFGFIPGTLATVRAKAPDGTLELELDASAESLAVGPSLAAHLYVATA